MRFLKALGLTLAIMFVGTSAFAIISGDNSGTSKAASQETTAAVTAAAEIDDGDKSGPILNFGWNAHPERIVNSDGSIELAARLLRPSWPYRTGL